MLEPIYYNGVALTINEDVVQDTMTRYMSISFTLNGKKYWNTENVYLFSDNPKPKLMKWAERIIDGAIEHAPESKLTPKDAEDADEKISALSKEMVVVTVIHKPSNDYVSKEVALTDVRKYAEAVYDSYAGFVGSGDIEAPKDEFVVVQYHLTSQKVIVTTL